MSAAKLAGLMGLVWGVVVGILVAIVGLGFTGYIGYTDETPFTGVVAIVAFPILYAISGFIGSYIFALLYNYVASKIGGVKVDLK